MRYAKDALKMISDLRQESPALSLWGPALNFRGCSEFRVTGIV
jgi:hypothetical protein